jgi:uracil-xanthine permease
MAIWKLHGDGKHIKPGEVVEPGERMSWPITAGVGAQHVVAMFGATFLVPILTGFDPSTTLFFTAVSTALFLLINKNRLPSYLGSSFGFIAPVLAATAATGDLGVASFGIMIAGLALAAVGLAVHFAGSKWIDVVMPPVVTGTIVAIIGFNLAPSAWSNFAAAPVTALVALCAILLVGFLFKGMVGRLNILIGVVIGYIFACFMGEVDFTAINEAAWFGLPDFHTPVIDPSVLGMFLPVILVLIAENIGHVKSVSTMTGRNYDENIGRSLFADGLGTAIAGLGGGCGTTTYAENIGVMAATRVYSTAAYWFAALFALLLSLCPKFGALINSVPVGVLGGACTLLYGMIGMLGVRIWVENHVDFGQQVNLVTASIPMVIGIADFTFTFGAMTFNGIAIGSIMTLVIYHLLNWVGHKAGTIVDAECTEAEAAPASEAR